MSRRRLDTELVRRGLVSSRSAAQHHIAAGDVLVGGVCADKAGRMVAPGEPNVLRADPPPFVSRAGLKLEAALEEFGISAVGLDAIDIGASTGGFTDCLLQRGARRVVALDVGHGQLDVKLRSDPRVVVVERCNVRDLDPTRCGPAQREALVGPPAGLVVVDVSFISLRTISGALRAVLGGSGDLVVLVKPQFEAGRKEVSRGRGIISEPEVWTSVLSEVVEHFSDDGLALGGLMVSPVKGARGNVEFVARFHHHSDSSGLQPVVEDQAALIAAVVAEVNNQGGG